jgi:peptidoglycan/LPS O-acetylase OafA/YrhL
VDPVLTSHRANNFDSLRILAALAVVFSHSIPLTYGPTQLDALWSFSQRRATLGSVAIQVFFIISGYLITASCIHTKSPVRFVRARALRLIPALVVVLALLVFVLGPILTIVPLHEYFRSTLPYRAVFGLSDHLPGVFTNNPFSSGIDGSLWTLRYEGLCYFAVLCLGLAGQLRHITIIPLFFILLVARLYFGGYAALEFGTLFAAGAVIFLLQLPLKASFAIPCAVLWIFSMRFGGFTIFSDTAGAYLVIFLGLSPGLKLPNLAKYGDLSYGVYIYAWPIQQTVSLLLGKQATWIINVLITVPVALGFAFASWHLVEFPALRLKDKNLLKIYEPARI